MDIVVVTYTFHIYGISRFVINDHFNLMYTTYSASIDKRQTNNSFKMINSEIKVVDIVVRVDLCIVYEQMSILNINKSIQRINESNLFSFFLKQCNIKLSQDIYGLKYFVTKSK